MKNQIKEYICDENAGVEDMIGKVVFFAAIIAAAGALIAYFWNTLQGQADQATDKLENMTNPGAGNEFSNGPF